MTQQEWGAKFTGKHFWFIIAGLTLLFFGDDLLMVLLVKELDFFQIDRLYYFLALAFMLFTSAGLALAVYYIMKKKPTTGYEALYDKVGEVLTKKENKWQIRLRGEIWWAESKDSLQRGDRVKVVQVENLVLTVDKVKVRKPSIYARTARSRNNQQKH